MRIPHLLLVAVTMALGIVIGCSKTKVVPPPVSIQVINAISNSSSIVPKFGSDTAGSYYKGPTTGATMLKVAYGSSQRFSTVGGDNPLLVVLYPDTNFKTFSGTVNLENGGIYSLFLSGDTLHADTMLVRDNIPFYGYDSSAGIRFVNMAVGGKALTINLTSDTTQTVFPALGYQQVTDFKKYATNTSVGTSYSFQIRDQASGTVLMPFTWTFATYKNNTIVIAGSTDPSGAPLKIFAVNNYY
ncbi:MAG TPA: hypothetical protein VHD83_13505 [Puia sp.]|nr:hypothetical protein [Puia sp.]